MRPDDFGDAFQNVARRFSDLRQALARGPDGPLPADVQRMLADRVRDALDRGEQRLREDDPRIIANSFTLESRIHQSPLTEVYRSRHRDLGTLHAIKTLRIDRADDPVVRNLLLRESKIGTALRHPRIVATQTLLRLTDGRPALVMEWCARCLADLLSERRLSIGEVVTIMRAVLSGIGAVHDAGLVHCDLSPSNILLEGSEVSDVKIADFGISLEAGRRHVELDLAFAGQPEFASPEQKAGHQVDARSDLYSAGLLLERLLQHCDAAGHCGPLKVVAARLSAADLDDRPASAEVALQLIDRA